MLFYFVNPAMYIGQLVHNLIFFPGFPERKRRKLSFRNGIEILKYEKDQKLCQTRSMDIAKRLGLDVEVVRRFRNLLKGHQLDSDEIHSAFVLACFVRLRDSFPEDHLLFYSMLQMVGEQPNGSHDDYLVQLYQEKLQQLLDESQGNVEIFYRAYCELRPMREQRSPQLKLLIFAGICCFLICMSANFLENMSKRSPLQGVSRRWNESISPCLHELGEQIEGVRQWMVQYLSSLINWYEWWKTYFLFPSDDTTAIVPAYKILPTNMEE
jgi:hypothetical protein